MSAAVIDVRKWLHDVVDELPKNVTLEEAVGRLKELASDSREIDQNCETDDGDADRNLYPGLTLPGEPDPEKRKQILRDLVERLGATSLAEDAPRFARDELHDRI